MRSYPYRCWSHKELALLRRHHARLPWPELAMLLPGRSRVACWQKARRLRLSGVRPLPERHLRALHARGLSDSEIARRLGRAQGSVSRWLRQHGCPRHHEPDGSGPFAAAARRRAAKAWGFDNWNQWLLSRRRLKLYAQGQGACTSPTQVEVMRLLHEQGPQPLAQLRRLFGPNRAGRLRAALRRLAEYGMTHERDGSLMAVQRRGPPEAPSGGRCG